MHTLSELGAGNNGAYHVTALMLAASQGRSPKLFDETPKKFPPPSQKTFLLSPEKLNACSDENFVHFEADFEVEIFEKQVGWRSCDQSGPIGEREVVKDFSPFDANR